MTRFQFSIFTASAIALGATLTSPAPANASIISPTFFNAATGHNYMLLATTSWTASEAEAVGLGGHLVTINNVAEHNWVWSTFGDLAGVARDLWIGINDAATEGNFVWSSGETPTYTNWRFGEPNNGGTPFANEDRGAMIHAWGGLWNDGQNSAPGLFGVVEINSVPAPGAVALFSLAGIVGLRRRRS